MWEPWGGHMYGTTDCITAVDTFVIGLQNITNVVM